MRTLIKNGTVVTASDMYAADLWIEDGKIVAHSKPGTPGQADETIDATGQYDPSRGQSGALEYP